MWMPVFTFWDFSLSLSFFLCGCIFVCAPHTCSTPRGKKKQLDPLFPYNLSYRVVSRHVDAGIWTLIFWKSSWNSWLLSHLSSPDASFETLWISVLSWSIQISGKIATGEFQGNGVWNEGRGKGITAQEGWVGVEGQGEGGLTNTKHLWKHHCCRSFLKQIHTHI